MDLGGGGISFTPQKFLLDDKLSSDLRRTGTQYSASLYFKREQGLHFWSPGIYLLGFTRHTEGTEYRSKGYAIEFANLFRVTNNFAIDFSVNVGTQKFDRRPGIVRMDTQLGSRLETRYEFRPNLVGTFSLAYTHNHSNVGDTYKFSRSISSLGATYRF